MIERDGIVGKLVLVTGAPPGSARATVAMFAREGARVPTCGRYQPSLDGALSDAVGARGSADGEIADVARTNDVGRVFASGMCRALPDCALRLRYPYCRCAKPTTG